MSEATNNIWDLTKQKYQYYHWKNFDYPGVFTSYRIQTGSWMLNKTLLGHDATYQYLRYKDIENMWLIRRPQAYFNNFVLEHFQKVTRPAIYYAGTGMGHALDKTVVRTWESASPHNLTYIYNHPQRAKKYFVQVGQNIQRYTDAIDINRPVNSLFNLKSLWLSNVSSAFAIQRHLWSNNLYSSQPIYRYNRVAIDKSKHLALSYYDITTDNIAEFIGWGAITALAFRFPKQARINTTTATEKWFNRGRLGYLPLTINRPIKWFGIRPVTRILYNPRILAVVVGYKLLSSLGRNIRDSIQLEENDPELYGILDEQGKSLRRASHYAGLSNAISQRNPKTNPKTNGI